jgi:hypothetical protein
LADCIAIFVTPVTPLIADYAEAFAIGFLADAAFSWLIFSPIDAPLASHSPASALSATLSAYCHSAFISPPLLLLPPRFAIFIYFILRR